VEDLQRTISHAQKGVSPPHETQMYTDVCTKKIAGERGGSGEHSRTLKETKGIEHNRGRALVFS